MFPSTLSHLRTVEGVLRRELEEQREDLSFVQCSRGARHQHRPPAITGCLNDWAMLAGFTLHYDFSQNYAIILSKIYAEYDNKNHPDFLIVGMILPRMKATFKYNRKILTIYQVHYNFYRTGHHTPHT